MRLRLLSALGKLAVEFHPVHLGISRRHRPLLQSLAFAIRLHDAEVMLRMLIEILGGDPVARGRGLARERDVALEHLIGVATDFDARTVAVEGLVPMRRPWSTIVVVLMTAPATHVVGVMTAAPRPLVLIRSHDTFEVLMHVLAFAFPSDVGRESPARLYYEETRHHGWEDLPAPIRRRASWLLFFPDVTLDGRPDYSK